jgi:2-methylcitrate dehydratase
VFRIDEYDSTIRRIAEYAVGVQPEHISASTLGCLVRHNLDSFGCAAGAFKSPVCRTALDIAASATVGNGASVLGLPERTTPEYATFANATLIRFLDYNDNYLRNGGGHTSDLIPAVLTACEQEHRSGLDFLVGLHVGYEVFAALADAIRNRDRGWDYPFFIGIAAAAATSKVLGLSVEQTASAVSMAITPSLPFGITRVGPLANWKGLASPFAAMNAFFVTRLASRGITGPPEAVEGHRGMIHLASGPFDLSQLGIPQDGLTAAERSSFKLFVAEFNAQGPVALFCQLHHDGVRPDDIAAIHIRTYEVAWSEIGGGQDDHDIKWDPRNKETADHSLPYMVAVALTDGDVTAESYSDQRILDPALRPLMERITVDADPGITATWEREPAHDIELRYTDGRVGQLRTVFAKGHPSNPASDEELKRKFHQQADQNIGQQAADDLEHALWSVPDMADINVLCDQFRSVPGVDRQ